MNRIKFNSSERTVLQHGGRSGESTALRLAETPILGALRRCGTRHLYADTADVAAAADLCGGADGEARREIDGNTANQPLVSEVIGRYLDAGAAAQWVADLRRAGGAESEADWFPLLYAIVCGQIGNDFVSQFAAGRRWEVSLQLHMGLCGRPQSAYRIGHLLHHMVPSALVKVPFTPDEPSCLLVARDLERDGIPVNLTSTFSARQAVTGALFADVTRTNVFMGRLSQGLKTDLLGEHVTLEAQRALLQLRRDEGVKSELIVASMREWQAFLRLAGCDVFTAPCEVLAELLANDELEPEQFESQLETSLEAELQIPAEVNEKLGRAGVERLYQVEPELIEFLSALRRTRESAELRDGEALLRVFAQAGFGDLFHSPDGDERKELRRAKLPDLDGRLIGRIPIDTHYSLLANADFTAHQEKIDRELQRRLPATGH